MTTLDAIDIDLNRHLASIERDDAFEAEVDRRAEELVKPGGDCYPFSKENLTAALDEICAQINSDEALAQLASDFETGNFKNAGISISLHIRAYWIGMANNQAEAEVSGSKCTHCFDRGCRRCDPPEPDDHSDRYFD